jgi:hypothetical protein
MNFLEMGKEGMSLCQNTYLYLSQALEHAEEGKPYGDLWEKAQNAQTHLLKVLNQLEDYHRKEEVKKSLVGIGKE